MKEEQRRSTGPGVEHLYKGTEEVQGRADKAAPHYLQGRRTAGSRNQTSA